MSEERDRYDRLGRWLPDGSWPYARRAPGGLETVRRFVNTQNCENGADLLANSNSVADWLTDEGFTGVTRVTTAQATAVRELRGTVRAAIVSAFGSAAEDLGDLATRVPIVASFGLEPKLTPTGTGYQRFVGQILIEVFEAQRAGTWRRLKACQHCMWTYYDHSKNQSASWCADGACGGRARAKNYRARQRAGS
jgi:predicted RNA-binding Zn ribbon-like protein